MFDQWQLFLNLNDQCKQNIALTIDDRRPFESGVVFKHQYDAAIKVENANRQLIMDERTGGSRYIRHPSSSTKINSPSPPLLTF